MYTLLKRYDQAIADLQQVLRMDSSCLRAASALGFLYATLGRNELAIEQFRSALSLAPENAVLHFDLGYIYPRLFIRPFCTSVIVSV